MEKLTEAMSDKEMKAALRDLGFAVKKLAKNYDRLMDAQRLIMSLEQDVFHEKWIVHQLKIDCLLFKMLTKCSRKN